MFGLFLGFINFDQRYNQGLSKLAKLLTLMLKTTTTRSTKNLSVSVKWLRMLRLETEQTP